MKILHVIPSLDPGDGGPVEAVRQLSMVSCDAGHLSEVACLDPLGAPWLEDLSLKVHTLGPGLSGYRYAKGFVTWLRAHASAYDHVVVHGLWQYTGFGTWLALRGTGTPYSVYTHGMLDPWFKRTYPLKHLKKWIYWPWAEYRVLRDAQAVLFTCEEERIQARGSFWLYHCNEVVVNFGTTTPPGDPRAQKQAFLARFPELRGKRLLLYLGRIHPKKGCDLLIEAFASVTRDPALHLVMAGPDQVGWQAQLERQTRQLGIEPSITWTGRLSGEVKWGALRAAEAFVLPSHQENFAIAVVEAMACGVPVLISNKVNIWREILADGAGLVADDSLEGTVQLLSQWLTTTQARKHTIQQNTRHSFAKRFEIHQAARSLLSNLCVGNRV